MLAQDYLSDMLKSMQEADNARQALSRSQKELDEVKAFWEIGVIKCEVLYNSLVRSYERSLEAWDGIVKTYDGIAASYSSLLIRSIQNHHAYLEERRRPAIARPCGF